jgi:hypothetical protein
MTLSMNNSRRHFLRGLTGTGAILLGPIANCLWATAEGSTKAMPQRFVFLLKSSGLTPDAITPPSLKSAIADQSRLHRIALKDHALPKSLRALEPFKEQVGIVRGFSGKMCLAGHTAWFGALGVHGSPSENSGGTPIRATLDTRLSARHPSPFKHIALALRGSAVGGGMRGTLYPGLSAWGPGREVPYQGDPDQAYHQLFGSAMASQEKRLSYDLESDMFDFLSADITRLQSNVPGSEKDKLEHYLKAFEDLQTRRNKLARMKDVIQRGAPELTDKYHSEVGVDRLESHFILAASSLISGLTHGVTIRMDGLEHIYSGLGITEQNVHAIGHETGSNGRTSLECRDLIREYHIKLIAKLAKKLQNVPEGDGTMLDNTMIIYMSDAAEAHHGSGIEWPYVIVGGCGGKLRIPGHYIQAPGYHQDGHRTIGNFYTSILNAYGDPVEHYGNLDITLEKRGISQRGPVSDLLA